MHNSGKRLRRITIIYWFLLLYIVAALVWWFISLDKQNSEMARLRLNHLENIRDTLTTQEYTGQLESISTERDRNEAKYLGEGVTFLTLILIGAGFVAGSIRKQFRVQMQQQNFMMAVTHELKTPIAVARLNLETLQKYHLDEEKQKKIIGITLQETARLNFLTSNILISSQLEGGGYAFSKEELNLSDLLADCLQDFRNRFPDRELVASIEPDTEVRGDQLLLQLLINNLIENAVKYSPRDKPITLSLEKRTREVVMKVKDLGEGIPGTEKKKIFDKFYRIGNELTRKAQGTGLGLYLCKKIAADHNATIAVTDNSPSGSIFVISFNKK